MWYACMQNYMNFVYKQAKIHICIHTYLHQSTLWCLCMLVLAFATCICGLMKPFECFSCLFSSATHTYIHTEAVARKLGQTLFGGLSIFVGLALIVVLFRSISFNCFIDIVRFGGLAEMLKEFLRNRVIKKFFQRSYFLY